MAKRALIMALGTIVAVSPASATNQDTMSAPAPAGSPDSQYCMRVEPITGSRLETIQCWTREQWADAGVDVDKDWAKEGVAVIEPGSHPVRG
jgi:hypothetical protein